MSRDYFELIIKIVIAIGIIFVIYWGLELLVGGSPSLTQFNTSMIMSIIGMIIHMYYKLGKFNQFIEGTFPRFEKQVTESFIKVERDVEKIKENLDHISRKL